MPTNQTEEFCPKCKDKKLSVLWKGKNGTRVYCVECGYAKMINTDGRLV